jgi:hypothetical protein
MSKCSFGPAKRSGVDVNRGGAEASTTPKKASPRHCPGDGEGFVSNESTGRAPLHYPRHPATLPANTIEFRIRRTDGRCLAAPLSLQTVPSPSPSPCAYYVIVTATRAEWNDPGKENHR